MQTTVLTCDDGVPITAVEFNPSTTAKGGIIIAPAMGVEQNFYKDLALWLTEQGYWVLTFDYRGMGISRHKPLSAYQHNIFTWAQLDASAVLKHALQKGMPITWLGHSLGGQITPLISNINQVKRIVTVAAGTGYWRMNKPKLRNKIWFIWYLVVPLLLLTHTYFPGKKWGIVGDLPKAVMVQWRRWCLHPNYCVGMEPNWVKEAFDNIQPPIKSLSITDDEMLTRRSIQTLLNLFGSKEKQLIEVDSNDYQIPFIGHSGFFKAKIGQLVWPAILAPLLST